MRFRVYSILQKQDGLGFEILLETDLPAVAEFGIKEAASRLGPGLCALLIEYGKLVRVDRGMK